MRRKRREIDGESAGARAPPDAGRRTKVTMAKALRASYSRREFGKRRERGGISGYCSRHDTVKFYGVVPAGSGRDPSNFPGKIFDAPVTSRRLDDGSG